MKKGRQREGKERQKMPQKDIKGEGRQKDT